MRRARRLGILLAGLLLAGSARAAESAASLRFEVSFPAGTRSEPADGRVFVILSLQGDPEPRLQFGKEGEQYRSPPFFGQDVEGLKPGQWAVVGGAALGYPIARLADIPPGDYFVQAMLNVYTTFHRADGHTLKLHADQWEGQVFQISPGNLYSEVRKMRLDPRRGETVRLTLTKKIPPFAIPADTEYVKRVRFQSALLSKFWGQPIFVGATVLLPRDYEKDKGVSYPVNYEQGHFTTGPPGGFGEKVEVPAGADERQKARARVREEFTKEWLSDGFPRMLFV
ncbi:MAG TPA: hypothetical protein VFZ57_02055, partial [Thermoanaerobaculia bacterium]|nr:hypothetical protein [Thermoanaerobaculia bacterium]